MIAVGSSPRLTSWPRSASQNRQGLGTQKVECAQARAKSWQRWRLKKLRWRVCHGRFRFARKSRDGARRKAARYVHRPRRIRRALGNHQRGAGIRFGLSAGDGEKSRAVAPSRPPCLQWPAELGKAEHQSHGRMLATGFEGRPPRLLRLPGAVLAFAYLLSGLVQLSLEFIIEFKLILEEFLKPFLEFYLFLRREFRDGGFDFLHGAHVDKSTPRFRTRQGSRNYASLTPSRSWFDSASTRRIRQPSARRAETPQWPRRHEITKTTTCAVRACAYVYRDHANLGAQEYVRAACKNVC